MNATEIKLSREEIVETILRLKRVNPQDSKTKEQIQKLQQQLDK
jgi:hypothetical protein